MRHDGRELLRRGANGGRKPENTARHNCGAGDRRVPPIAVLPAAVERSKVGPRKLASGESRLRGRLQGRWAVAGFTTNESGMDHRAQENWSDQKSWWMDLLKWSITLTLGFAVTFFIFDTMSQRRLEIRAVCDAKVSRMQRTVERFRDTSYTYPYAAEEAFIELYRWRDEQPTDPLRHYWGSAHDDLAVSLEEVELLFGDIVDVRARMEHLRKAMLDGFAILDKDLIDPRLDRIAALYRDSRTSLGEEIENRVAPISRIELDGFRSEHAEAADRFRQARNQLLLSLEGALDRPAGDLCGYGAKPGG